MEKQTIQLPFNKKFQAGLIVAMIKDYDFYRNISDDLLPSYLDAGQAHIKLLKIVKGTASIYKKPLTIDIIRNSLIALEKQEVYTEPEIAGINAVIDTGLGLTLSELAYVKREAFEFLKKQVIAKAVSESIVYLEENKLDDVYKAITDAYKKTYGIGENIGYDYRNSSISDRYSEPPRKGIWSSGFPKLDQYIDGGFASSEAYTVISPTGRGKTALLCNFGVTALQQRKNCLFLTLEMREGQIAQRQDSILCGFSATEIANSREYQMILDQQIQAKVTGENFIKGFNRGSLSMGAFRTYLDRFCNDVWKPDVLIFDWLGCVKLPAGGKDTKKHELLAEVADDFINLTRDYDLTGISAHQSNRSAVSKDTFAYDTVSESFASLFGMDLVLGLGATNEAKDAGKRTLSILKSRMGPDSVYTKLMGDLPGKPLTFRFKESLIDDDEEKELLEEQK